MTEDLNSQSSSKPILCSNTNIKAYDSYLDDVKKLTSECVSLNNLISNILRLFLENFI